MRNDIKAIAFDIDGTFYSGPLLYLKMLPFVLRNVSFLLDFWRLRRRMHKMPKCGDFRASQAAQLAKIRGCSAEDAGRMLQKSVYDGFRPYIEGMRVYDGIEDLILAAKAAGLKIAVLSDFPPEQKGDLWGLRKHVDVSLGSEECGVLKPAREPFALLAERLSLAPENVLYVGNSHKYDVVGAKNAGMQAAYFVPWIFWPFHRRDVADVSFCRYASLAKWLDLKVPGMQISSR